MTGGGPDLKGIRDFGQILKGIRPGEIDVSVRVRPIVGNYVERRYV